MLEQMNRRQFLRRTAEFGAGAAIAALGFRTFEAKKALAEPAFPSWQPSLNAQPEAPAAMVPWTIKFDAGKTAEVIGGPIEYSDPFEKKFKFLGQSDGGNRISVVLIKNGTPGIEMKVWGGGNWEGITDNPYGAALTEDGEKTLIVDSYKAITNPANGNGKNHDGKFDEVNLAVIDGPTGKIVKVGNLVIGLDGNMVAVYKFDLEPNQPIQVPGQAKPTAEPAQEPTTTGTESNQPRFVSETPAPVATQQANGSEQPTEESKENSFDLQPGKEITVKKGSIIRGEFMYKDAKGNWVVKYDSNGQTGLVSIIDEDVQVMTNYAVGIVENVQGDLVARANAFAAEQVANGCENGQGCSKGVFIARVPEGPFQKN